jgi:hypothetical protein
LTSTPSTQRLLDSVAVSVPHLSTERGPPSSSSRKNYRAHQAHAHAAEDDDGQGRVLLDLVITCVEIKFWTLHAIDATSFPYN